jgi:mttA/Hcf106 family
MSFLSPVHIVFFAAIALLALGPKRFPEFTRTLGRTLRGFREAINGVPAVNDLVGDGWSAVSPDGAPATLAVTALDAPSAAPAPLAIAADGAAAPAQPVP